MVRTSGYPPSFKYKHTRHKSLDFKGLKTSLLANVKLALYPSNIDFNLDVSLVLRLDKTCLIFFFFKILDVRPFSTPAISLTAPVV